MSNTFFIDANVKNSTNVNDTFNRFTYKLPNAVELPTGTTIGLQSSIINLQGITGASIEITEDIEETIIYQYYAMDANYPSPIEKAQFRSQNNFEYNLTCELTARGNQDQGENAPSGTFPTIDDTAENLVGYSESIMPLLSEVVFGDGTRTAVPMLGKSQIIIKKGVYGINKLADEITNQINLTRIPGDRPQDFYKYQRFNNQYSGYIQNNATLRTFQIEANGTWGDIQTNAASAIDQLIRLAAPQQMGALDYKVYNTATGLASVIAVSANTARTIKDNAASGGFGAGRVEAGCSIEEICANTSANKQYFIGWEQRNGYQFKSIGGQPGRELSYSNTLYNPFSQGIGFGTSQMKVSYDNQHSAYTLSYLHQPRKIPSNDRFGNSMDNAGQECVYLKQPADDALQSPVVVGANVRPSLTTVISKLSGILVINWAYDTCRKQGDMVADFTYANPNLTAEEQEKCDQYKYYNDFFSTDEKCEEAWKTTIWARMGFEYDDIQNPKINGAGNNQYFQYNINQNCAGFTTDQAIDVSIAPSVSTLNTGITLGHLDSGKTFPIGKTTDPANAATRGALPAVSNIQYFNFEGINVPKLIFNNNVSSGSDPCIDPFKGSFYRGAVMIPVITEGKAFVASKLPTLSTNGYLMITSDLVEGNDILKNQQTDGLLDIIPKSSLSNQDYMADRNIITHTLSNPKSINEINIKILNPDMTDITLEPNSQVLVRITLPTPKPTNFLQEEELEAQSQQVGAVVNNMIASHTDPNKAQTNLRLDISNLSGVGGGAEGVGGGEVELAQQAIVQNAIADTLQGLAPALPQGGLAPNAEDLAAIQATGQLAAIGIAEGIVEEQQGGTSAHSGIQFSRTQGALPITGGGLSPEESIEYDRQFGGGRNDPYLGLRDEAFEEEPEERAGAGAGRSRAPPDRGEEDRPREVLKQPEYPARGSGRFGEEPRPSTQAGALREGEVRKLSALKMTSKQQAQARLEQLEEARRRAQGREVALGRTPREHRDIKQQIANMTAEIDRLEKVIRGFGGTPDPPVVRERRLAEIAANQRRRVAEGSPSKSGIGRDRRPARRGRGNAPDPEAPARRVVEPEEDPNVITEADML
jgi:hypothetical protein